MSRERFYTEIIIIVQLMMMLACLCRWRRRPYCLLSAEMSSVMRACRAGPSWAAPRGGFAERAPFLCASGDEEVPPSRGTAPREATYSYMSAHFYSQVARVKRRLRCSSAMQQS